MNYRRNEDKLCNTGGPNYNLIHSVEDISEESGPEPYPVTLTEVKEYMRLEGFDDSGEFDFDDDLIEGVMIPSATHLLEKYTGSHFYPKLLKVYFTNGGMIDLPGPVKGTISLVDSLGTAIEDSSITLIGSVFPSVRYPEGEYMVATYYAGYDVLPKGLKLAILMQIAYDYTHRGDEEENVLCKKAAQAAFAYKKVSAFA